MRLNILFASCSVTVLLSFSEARAASVFDLDFTGAVARYTAATDSLVIDVIDVAIPIGSGTAPKIDLRVESKPGSPYEPRDDNPAGTATGLLNNGTPSGTDDLRIHQGIGTATTYTFSLYDGTTPGSFTTLYNPGSDYGFTMMAYDIDGSTNGIAGKDVITVSNLHSYTLDTFSLLAATKLAEKTYRFYPDPGNPASPGEIAGQAGLATFTEIQSRVSVFLEFKNTNQFELTYAVENLDPNAGTGRNLLLDGSELTIDDFFNPPVTTTTTAIPEPSVFILGLLGLPLVFRRDRHTR